jgi:Rrf2 family protein
MRLTRAAEYAVRCILYLSGLGVGVPASRKEITRAMDIPEAFMAKIAQQLSRAGFIEITQGARGGYRLAVPPDRITLLDVVETVNGGIFLNDCLMRPGACTRDRTCPVHRVWQRAREQLRATLGEADFEYLAREAARQEPCSSLSGAVPGGADSVPPFPSTPCGPETEE